MFPRRTLAAGYGAEHPVCLAVDPVSEVEGIGTAIVAADPELDRPKAVRAHAAGADRKRPVKLPADRVERVDLAEGWVCLRAAYDDGGFSGATMDRPALQQLLEDITVGRVDTVVVYKIDRLTRSLADFAKIVEILDAKGASFVSVQQFNTTTSMGA
jgi:hypothetical protein